MSSYPPTPQRKACNCSDPCVSTDDVYYAGPNLPNSGINTYNVLTEVIEKLDAIYAVPTLQRVTEMGNITTLPIIADSFVKIGGDGNNILLDNGTTISLSSIGGSQNLQQVTDLGNAIVLPSNKNRAIDILLPDLVGVSSKGIFVTIEAQTGTYPNPDAYVARIKGQNPGSLPNFISAFYAVVTGADNYTVASEHNIGTVTSTHFHARNETGVTSDFANFYTNVNVFKIDYLGNTTAAKFIKEGGNSSQFLMADGSTSLGLGYTPVNKAGDTMLGNLILNQDPSTALQAATKQYVDNNVPVIQPVSATETGVVNNTSLQELGGVDKTINGVRVGRGNISDPVSENTAVGYQALQSVVHTTGDTGYYNTAFGDSALKSLTTGYGNDAFGDWALKLCTTGYNNSAFGSIALANLTTGTFNIAFGGGALYSLTTGLGNVAIGNSALNLNISGQRNTALGVGTLQRNTGSNNTAIGYLAGAFTNSTGNWNILVGMQAGRDITTGSNNLLIENITNASITSGSYNIVLNPKQKSGVTTGSYNTIIGCWDGTFPTTMANNVIIGDGQGNIRFRTTDTGLTTVPGQTNTLIDGDATGKAVVNKEYVNNRLVVETTTGYTLTNADSGGIIIFKTTAAQTLTIPTGLADGFECTFVTLSGVTLTVVSTGNTLNNATSTTMLPQLSFTLKRMLAANTYIVAGSL